MGVPNYENYTVSEHAKERILTRFNITNAELPKWIGRLLSQCVYEQTQEDGRHRYRLHDLVVIVNPKTKTVITVYDKSANEVSAIKMPTNPEIQTVIVNALDDYENQKKVKIAIQITDLLAKSYEANQRMIKPYANYRFTNKSYDEMVGYLDQVHEILSKGKTLLKEAEVKKNA